MSVIRIAEDFVKVGLRVALAVVQARVVVGPADDGLVQALEKAANHAGGALSERKPAELPSIAAARRAYKALGKDPSRYRSSCEALMRRVVQGKPLHNINNIVDTNNLISLQACLSVGTYDQSKSIAPFTFRRGRCGEHYQAIGRGEFNLEGLPLLADATGPFGSPSSDSERTMICETTQKIMMVIFDFEAEGELDAVLALASGHLRDYCAASDFESIILEG